MGNSSLKYSPQTNRPEGSRPLRDAGPSGSSPAAPGDPSPAHRLAAGITSEVRPVTGAGRGLSGPPGRGLRAWAVPRPSACPGPRSRTRWDLLRTSPLSVARTDAETGVPTRRFASRVPDVHDGQRTGPQGTSGGLLRTSPRPGRGQTARLSTHVVSGGCGCRAVTARLGAECETVASP